MQRAAPLWRHRLFDTDARQIVPEAQRFPVTDEHAALQTFVQTAVDRDGARP